MHIAECIFLFIFVVLATETTARNAFEDEIIANYTQNFPDPRRNARETCRKRFNYTPEQLIAGRRDFRKISPFLACLGQSSGQVTPDYRVVQDRFIKNLSGSIPTLILQRAVPLCIYLAYGKNPIVGSLDQLADYNTCFGDMLAGSIYDALGVLEPSRWRPFEEFQRW